jgi:hypothetical protein
VFHVFSFILQVLHLNVLKIDVVHGMRMGRGKREGVRRRPRVDVRNIGGRERHSSGTGPHMDARNRGVEMNCSCGRPSGYRGDSAFFFL